MKKYMIFAGLVMAAASMSAQTKVSNEQIALSLTPSTTNTCFHAGVKDGTPWSKKCGGIYVGVEGSGTFHSWDNTSNMDGFTSTYGARALFGYKWIRKNWFMAPKLEAFLGFNSSATFESRRTNTSLVLGGAGYVELFPHAPVRLNLGCEVEGFSITSQNDNGSPYKGHVITAGPAVKVVVPLGCFKTHKDVQVGNALLHTDKKHEVSLFVKGSYKKASVEKFWDGSSETHPKMDDKMWNVSIGITANLW